MILNYEIKEGDFVSAGVASSQVKKTLKQLNLSPKLLKRVAVALYEAEVNVVAHARCGSMKIEITNTNIYVEIDDKGPGIESIDDAMTEGFSTASQKVREMGFGAGMGLPNIQRNVDKMSINSVIGVGTNLKLEFNITGKKV